MPCSGLQKILAPGLLPDTQLLSRNFLGEGEPEPSPPTSEPATEAASVLTGLAAVEPIKPILTACDNEVTEPVPPEAPEAVKDDIAACAAAAAAKLSLFCRRFTNNELVKLLSLCSNLTLEEDIALEDELLEDEASEAASEAAVTDEAHDEAFAAEDVAEEVFSDFIDDDLRCLSSSSVIRVMDMI